MNLCRRLAFLAIGCDCRHSKNVGEACFMVSEIPLTCPHCGKTLIKSVEWVQQNTFFTCQYCGTAAMIDKDVAAQMVAQQELRQRP